MNEKNPDFTRICGRLREYGEKFEEYDAMGNPNETIVIPEIVCLGKEG